MNPQVADMDQDGDLDLIIGTRAGHIEYFERQSDGSLLGPDTLFDIPAGANSNPLVVDWNGDKYPDLLLAGIHTYHDYPRPIYLFVNEGKEKYTIDSTVYDSVEAPLADSIEKYRTIAWADMDGDGLGDLLVSHSFFELETKTSYFKIRWHRNKGTKEQPLFDDYSYLLFNGIEDIGQEGSTFRLPYITAEDYNGDGVPDILMGASQQKLGEPTEQVAVWYGTRTGVGVKQSISFSQKPKLSVAGKTFTVSGLSGEWAYTISNSRGQQLQNGIISKSAGLIQSNLAGGVYTLQLQQNGLVHPYQVRF